jgi:thiol-disulfide isomerase/thioredoxin
MFGNRKPKPHARLILILVAAGVLLIGAAVFAWMYRGKESAIDGGGMVRPPAVLNQATPRLALSDLQGDPVSLETYRGKVVLINNWATWCPPCKEEMPELQAYYQAHIKQGFVIVAIESGEPAATVAGFVRQFGLTFPVWLDPDGRALDAFKNMDLPSSYVVDQQGTVRMNWTGQVNQATLEKYVTPLLEK